MSVSFVGRWAKLLTFQGAGAILAFATIALASYLLPPEIYGRYGSFLSIVQISYAVGFSWISHAALRFGREEFRDHGTLTTTIGSAITISSFLVVIVFISSCVLWITVERFENVPALTFLILIVGLSFFILFECATYVSQAAENFAGFSGGQLIAKAGFLIALCAILVGLPADPNLLFTFTTFGWCLAFLWTISSIRGHFDARLRPTGQMISRMFSYGYLLPIAAAAGVTVHWLGFWVLRETKGVDVAGVYFLAAGAFALGTMTLLPLGAVLAPGMLDIRLHSRKLEIVRRAKMIVSASVCLALFMPIMLACLQALTQFAFPLRYAMASPVLTIMLTAMPAQLINYTTAPLVQAYEHMVPKTVLLNVVVALINIVAMVLLIPKFGIIGAAVATSVAIGFSAIARLFLVAMLGGTDGETWKFIARFAVPLIIITSCGIAISQASAAGGLAIGFGVTVIGITLARMAGIFLPLAELRPHIAIFSPAVQPFAERMLVLVSGEGGKWRE